VKSAGWTLKHSGLRDGKPSRWDEVIPPQPQKKFRLSKALAAGKPPGKAGDGYGELNPWSPPGAANYPVSSVKKGDSLIIEWSRVDWVDVCDNITIYRRPGGRVPASPWRHQDSKYAWDDVANAGQDFEEKGIPLPKWLDPNAKPKLIQ